MTEWYDQHYTNPYPSFKDCEDLALAGKVSVNQVKQWFVNVRRRTHNQFRKRRTNTTKRQIRENINQEEILKALPLSSDDSGISNSKEILDVSVASTSPYSVYNSRQMTPIYSNNYMRNYTPNNSQYYNQSYDSPRQPYSNYNYSYTSTPMQQSYINPQQHQQQPMNANTYDRNYNYYFQQPVNTMCNSTNNNYNNYNYSFDS
jgi:hypothetical protein